MNDLTKKQKREVFTAYALQGLVAGGYFRMNTFDAESENLLQIADCAVRLAETTLARLERENEEEIKDE